MFHKSWLAEINRLCVAFLLLSVLVVGGLGWTQGLGLVSVVGGLVAFLILAIELLLVQSKSLPAGLGWYGLFLTFLVVSVGWSVDKMVSLEHGLLFSSAGLFAITSHRLGSFLRQIIGPVIFGLGAIFFGLWLLWMRGSDLVSLGYSSLIKYASDHQDHNHIGDFGVVVAVASLGYWKKSKLVTLIGLSMAALMVFVGHSRSSLVSLGVVLVLIVPWNRWRSAYPKQLWLAGGLLIGLFLWFGSHKSLLFSRPYFIQSVAGVVGNPFGVGLGNFAEISADQQYHWLGMDGYSQLTHNLFLEVLSGIGIFSLAFGWWWLRAFGDALESLQGKRKWYGIFFLALMTNFLFDTTYFIPTMLWLWFIAWGLLASVSIKSKWWDQMGAAVVVGVHVLLVVGWSLMTAIVP